VTKAASNKGVYSNPEFDALITQAGSAATPEDGIAIMQQAEEILLKDLPVIPLWYYNANGAWSEKVDNVNFDWRGQPLVYEITKTPQDKK
jgi:ABC-type oligopeptide transport system